MQPSILTEKEVHLKCNPDTQFMGACNSAGSLGISYHTGSTFSVNLNSAIGQVRPREGSLDTNLEVPENETRLKFDLGAVKQFGYSGKLTLTTFGVIQKNAIVLSGTTYTDVEVNVIRELYDNRDQNQMESSLNSYLPDYSI